jgi:hypothetical protein
MREREKRTKGREGGRKERGQSLLPKESEKKRQGRGINLHSYWVRIKRGRRAGKERRGKENLVRRKRVRSERDGRARKSASERALSTSTRRQRKRG